MIDQIVEIVKLTVRWHAVGVAAGAFQNNAAQLAINMKGTATILLMLTSRKDRQ